MNTPRPSPNGHNDTPGAFKKPAPHPVPSLAAQMAEADAKQQEAAQAELARRTAELREHISLMLATDPASLIMAIPDLFGASLVEMVAAGVQIGLQRAAQAEQQRAQAPAEAAGRKPILLAQAPLNAMMIREAGGVPGVHGGTQG